MEERQTAFDINVLQKRLSELKNKDYTSETNQNNDYWNRLNDYIKKFSPAQLEYVLKTEEVIEADKKMKDMFLVFLFEKYKGSFASIEQFKPICDEYIDTILQAGKNFENYSKNIEAENEELKKQIAELKRKVNNGKSNTNRA